MTYESFVKESMNAVNPDVLTSELEKRVALLLQLSLNCLIMFEIFSKRSTSLCSLRVELEMTRKVAFSNMTTSSASQMFPNATSCSWRMSTFGMSVVTIVDHALYSVSSQMDVRKHWIFTRPTFSQIPVTAPA